MTEHKRLTILIPAYNEAGNLPAVLANLVAQYGADDSVELLVVDDGSSDNTGEVVREHPRVRLVQHLQNRGYGAAIKTGVRHALGQVTAVIDADGQHDPQDIDRLVGGMGGYDLVVGARSQSSETTLIRNLANRVMSGLASYTMRRPLVDVNSGFQVFRTRLMRAFATALPDDMTFSISSKLSFLATGCWMKFEPIAVRARSHGSSHIRPLRDGLTHLAVIGRTIMMFHPARVLGPLALLIGAVGLGWGINRLYTVHGGFPVGALLLLGIAMFTALLGFQAEQLAQIRHQLYAVLITLDRPADDA
ncbi:MAG: glycosyltransferase family 2 protein [Armatimonadetes bacterium]|nr:glycosyltransferase family 2 protein [Armatimonadota bacterium]